MTEIRKIKIWHCELDAVPEGWHLSCASQYDGVGGKESVIALVGEEAPPEWIWEEAHQMIDSYERHAMEKGIQLYPLQI